MISPSQPPLNVLQAFKDGLGDFVPAGNAVAALFQQSQAIHQVYSLDAKKTAASGPRSKLKDLVNPTGWRLLAAGSGLAGACHVNSAQNASPSPKLTGFSNEPVIGEVVAFIGELQNHPKVQAGTFSLQALRVPWLKFETFWLVSQDGNDANELVVPYAGFPEAGGLQLHTPGSASAFLQKVRPLSKGW